jgi:hypothetical protein
MYFNKDSYNSIILILYNYIFLFLYYFHKAIFKFILLHSYKCTFFDYINLVISIISCKLLTYYTKIFIS